MKKVLFSATVDSHILAFHLPYLKYFKENGYEVHVATNSDEEIPYCDKKHKICFERSPFKLNNIKAIRQLKKVIEKENFDVIHTHTPMGGVVTRLAATKARKNGTRVIYTAHGFHFFKGAPKLYWIIFYPVEKILAKHTDEFITINEEDYMLAKNKFKTNVKYVHGVGIDEQKFEKTATEKEKQDLRKSFGIKTDDFVITCLAELNKNKNQEFLINSLEELIKENKDIHLLLVGKDSYNGYHENLIKSKGLENNIHLTGFRKDVANILQISNVSVSASKREGLPVNIMEAMYLGLPIVATDCRGNRDLVKDGKNGYIIAQNDSEKFVAAISDIYNKKVDIEKLGQNSKKEVKKYLLKNVMKEMRDIYEKNSTYISK